jgi:hypothetical protein
MGQSRRSSVYVNANGGPQQLAMGESNMDDIDRRIAEDDRFPFSRNAVAPSRHEQPPTGTLSEAYALLAKGLQLAEVASELRMDRHKLIYLLGLDQTRDIKK